MTIAISTQAPSKRDTTAVHAQPPATIMVSVEEGYERWAAVYDTAPNPLLALEEREIGRFLPDLRGRTALDLGCGTGRWLSLLRSRGAVRSVGIDTSKAMLQKAALKLSASTFLIRADCRQLPLRTASVDFAICSFVVCHFSELGTLVRECSRVLRPGAALFVTDLHPEAYRSGWYPGFRDGLGSAKIVSFAHSRREIINEFCSSGFDCGAVDEFRFDQPERPIFTRAGKENFFPAARQIPAVLACRFRRAG